MLTDPSRTDRAFRQFDRADASQVPRRQMLVRAGAGFGAVALAGLLGDDVLAGTKVHDVSSTSIPSPLAAQLTHHLPRAKSVIFLFMEGGPSHIDTFDPKPRAAAIGR